MEDESNEWNQVHNLDEVNDRLYRRDLAGREVPRADVLHQKSTITPRDWNEDTMKKSKFGKIKIHHSFFRKFFFISLGFALVAVLFAVVMFFTGGNTVSNANIDINVLGNSFTAGGEELPLQVEVVNKNASALELSDLFIEYDKGGDATSGASHVRDLNSLGTIDAGKTSSKSFFVTLYGEQGSTKNVDFTLQYRLHGSNAIFVKKTSFVVTINSAPVSLSVDGPKTITPNQTLTFTVKTVSNSKNTLSGMLLHVDYPTGFNVTKSVPDANAFNNVWNLGDLAPGAERDVVITGTVYGQDGEDRAFHVYTGAVSADDATKIGVTYNSLLQTVSLVKPFLATHLSINGSTVDPTPIGSGSTVTVAVTYANNLPTRVTDASIVVQLSGNALNADSIIVPKGFYDSAKNTITWNKTTDADLGSIEPSDQGILNFTCKVLPLWSAGTTIVKPTIKFSASITGKQPDQGGAVDTVSDFEDKTAVVDSDLGFTAAAAYSTGPFSNTGPIPPQANQPTTYTVTWTATNSANALADGLATATLPTYVDWVGTISPSSESLQYDATTSTIRWNFGQVPAGAGISGTSRKVSFQVRLNPSTSQVGSVPKLVLDTAVTARDTFTGDMLSLSRGAISTQLQNDPTFPANGQTVTK
jgi:hypothetical protein